MNQSLLENYYDKRGFENWQKEEAVRTIVHLEAALMRDGLSFESVDVHWIKNYVRVLVDTQVSELEMILAQARYFYLIGRNEIYIYYTSLLGGVGVMESIEKHVEELVGADRAKDIFNVVSKPRIGSSPEVFPQYTAEIMKSAEAKMTPREIQLSFAHNNHGISAEPFIKERERLHELGDLDAYLADYQKRKIEELQQYCDENRVWFEQKITQAVVDYAASNQEIMSAVRVGNVLYATKIPYDPDNYLKATDDKMKRYYACHCPFVREAILNDQEISENWCYCSGGFSKFPYEVILERPLEVELLACALRGDHVCRFAIKLD